VSAAQLNADDTEFYRVGLTIESGVIAASTVRDSVVQACGALTLLADKLRHSWFPGCGVGPLRVYETSVIGGRFDGEIESDRSTWETALFGSLEPTDLLMFDGAVSSVNFCGESRVRFADTATARCTRCDGWFEPGAACMDPVFPSMFNANFCEFLRDVPICEQPLPPRERPLPLP
jgi:hypothetical protein